MREPRWPLHYGALALVSVLIGLLFIREPGFGDDFTYWSFAFDLRERGLDAWQRFSFHDLRWPVWGVCWLLQGLPLPGLFSYYGQPLLYLAAGAVLAFALCRLIAGSPAVAWSAGLAFVFHPLLDTVCYRPMADMSEGVWGAATVLAWWCLMQSPTRAQSVAWALMTGACVFILESNRITGAFIVPVLILCTLLYARRRFGWLVAAGVFSAIFYMGEAAFYHGLFGDWMHSIHANLGNKGAKGTESPPLWYMPFRFLDTLWKGNPLAPLYCVAAAAGCYVAWKSRWAIATPDLSQPLRPRVPLGKVVVVWFGSLYLIYALAPQSIWPWRPMIRDADRFLCGLAIPMSVLAALGCLGVWRHLAGKGQAWSRILIMRPVLAGVVAVVLLALTTSRAKFDIGFVPEMRAYMRTLAPGTRVFTHEPMRLLAHLVDDAGARRLAWSAPNRILHGTPELEQMAAGAAHFWYARKLVWLNTRKQLEKGKMSDEAVLGSYFSEPERDWYLTRLLAKGDTPDLVFYRKRQRNDPPPLILSADAPEWRGLLPSLPATWRRGAHDMTYDAVWSIPASLRGALVRVELNAASPHVEAMTVRLRCKQGDRVDAEYLLKPYLYPRGGREFFVLSFPPGADACDIQLKFSRSAQEVRFDSLRLVTEAPRP